MRLSNIISIFGLLILISQGAFAQPLVSNEFNEASEEQVKRAYTKDPASINRANQQQKSSMERNRMNSISEGVSALGKGTPRRSTNVYAPMAGFSDTMFSKEHANQLGKNLSSPMVLYNTTMMLTEPAVAGGMQNAALQAYGSLQTRYLAEEQFMRELDSSPETKQIMLSAYHECVANQIRMRNNTPPGQVPPEDSRGWIEAQSVCMGDRTTSIGNMGFAAAKQFDQLAGSGQKTGIGFDMRYDPDHPQWLGATGANENTIKLTDYIFNQSNYKDVGLGNSPDAVKQAFFQMLGDYEFTIEAQTVSNARSASRDLQYRKIDAPIKRSDILDQTEKFYYDQLKELLGKKCEYNKELSQKQVNDEAQKADDISYCTAKKDELKQKFLELSFIGFEFDCNILEDLYKIFVYDNKTVRAQGGSQGTVAQVDCNPIMSGDYEQFKNQTMTPSSGQKNLVFLASEISLGKLYMVLYNITQVVDNLTVHNESFVKMFAYQLINDFKGSGNFYDMYSGIINNIEVFKAKLIRDIANKERNNNAS